MKKIVLNKEYIPNEIKSSIAGLEESEATCSYMLKNKNGFLKGKSYGEAFFTALTNRNIKNYSHILEIGAGTGDLALNFLNTLKSKKKDYHYTILDTSPELIKTQKRVLSSLAPKVRWIEGNANEEKSFETRFPYDLVLANEMVGYLEVQIVSSGQEIPFLDEKIARVITTYSNIIKTPLILPIGLIKLLKNLDKKTSSEVTIVISEYFTKVGGGSVMNHLGQKEFCLNIYFVMDLIRALGFEIESAPLLDFMDFDLNFKPLSKDLTNLISDSFPEIHRQVNPLAKSEQLIGDVSFHENQAFINSSAEWISKFVNYSFLVLKKKKTFEWFGDLDNCKAVLSENVTVFNKEGDLYILRNSPQIFISISEEDLKLIKLIKKDISVTELLKFSKKIYLHEDGDNHTLHKLQIWFEKGIISLATS
ncbi:MAG: SAM-dependent methyltransferase [Bdellovibrionales bacterium]|nr:SAM-dependent methyltransferase [Bdellovibrionales bacterium]